MVIFLRTKYLVSYILNNISNKKQRQSKCKHINLNEKNNLDDEC